jgi:hypothetical protein
LVVCHHELCPSWLYSKKWMYNSSNSSGKHSFLNSVFVTSCLGSISQLCTQASSPSFVQVLNMISSSRGTYSGGLSSSSRTARWCLCCSLHCYYIGICPNSHLSSSSASESRYSPDACDAFVSCRWRPHATGGFLLHALGQSANSPAA